jgi:hypothetical protein
VEADSAINIMRCRGGVPVESLSVGEAVSLLAADQVWFSGDTEDWRRQLVLGQGGEIIEDVDVIEMEVAGGRVKSIETDYGREWVDSVMFFDLPVHRLVAWLPRGLARVLAGPAARVSGEHRVEALVRVDRCSLPVRVLVGDDDGVWQLRAIRSRETGTTHVAVDICFAGEGHVLGEAEAVLDRFLGNYASYIQPFGAPVLRVTERSLLHRLGDPLIERLNGLGLYHASQVEQWLRGVARTPSMS